jgi:hypothetical protein
MPRTARLTDALRGHGKALALAGAAAATLAGAGAASAATVAGPAHAPAAAHSSARTTADTRTGSSRRTAQHTTTAVAHTAAAHAASPASKPARPYQIYDSVTPSSIPAHHEIATYADGGYAVKPAQVAGKKVLWIDTRGTDPKANALDVEPGDASPTQAASWTRQKLDTADNSTAIIYTMRSEWPSVRSAINTLPSAMREHVRYWIADPTGVPHVVPGASATQWYWGSNYDITTANPGF